MGYFHYIPFPSFEVFRILPPASRREILEGLLGFDLIGFHTYEYTQYFLRSVLPVVGLGHDRGQIVVDGHLARVETLSLGVDFERFTETGKKIRGCGGRKSGWPGP